MGHSASRILFIEDDASGRELGLFNLIRAGYDVATASNGKDGLKLFASDTFDLVITDVKMPGMSGMDVLTEIRKSSDVPVLVITAYADVETAVLAMKKGADDFIGKPFNRDFLLMTVQKALRTHALGREVAALRMRAGGIERPVLHASTAMKRVLEVADKVAKTEATILITGESGTGKELVARRIHVGSPRGDKPFVAVNAAAIPSELLESELFGHIKGAFTGASADRPGRFRQAAGGTLFLDEIGELPQQLQSKLLRVLQERVVDVVGADIPIAVDVRIIAATNKNLPQEVHEHRFREDLYYRLNVLEIPVPPLRERVKDIPLLAKHFIELFADGRSLIVPSAVLDRLCAYSWPGNVRELENVCQRLAILAVGNEVKESDLPFSNSTVSGDAGAKGTAFDSWPPLPPDGLSIIDLEKRVIERVLTLKDNNVSQTAAYLGIPRHVLSYRMEKYGIVRK